MAMGTGAVDAAAYTAMPGYPDNVHGSVAVLRRATIRNGAEAVDPRRAIEAVSCDARQAATLAGALEAVVAGGLLTLADDPGAVGPCAFLAQAAKPVTAIAMPAMTAAAVIGAQRVRRLRPPGAPYAGLRR